MNVQLNYKNSIHFIGIGGAGMSGLARVLLTRKYKVTGSDMNQNFWTQKLSDMGAYISLDHRTQNISRECQCIVVSTAIKEDNPELIEAKRLKIPVLHRSQMLNLLVKDNKLLAVAGTHGKTTTSSMLTAVYEKNHLDPVVFIGAEFDEIQGNSKDGSGSNAIIEADESDGSFLNYAPFASIITNIDEDHLDFYGSYSKIQEYFLRYINNHDKSGFIVLCGDDQGIIEIKEKIKDTSQKIYFYGINNENDFTIHNISSIGQPVSFDIYQNHKFVAHLQLQVPGRHNIYNATAVFVLSLLENKINGEQIVNSLSSFRGAQRRFQIKGKVNNIIIVDDYGHHPREIEATIQTAIQFNPDRKGRLLVAFQPHRFTRTQYFFEDFARSFQGVDFLFLMDIYSAGEKMIPGINSRLLFDKIQKNRERPQHVIYSCDYTNTVNSIYDSVMPGDTLLTIGAGDVYRVGEGVFNKIRERQ